MKVSAQTRGSPAVAAYTGKDGKPVAAQPAVPPRGPVVVEINIPDGTEALTKAFGAEVVGSAAKGAIIISAQAFMRRLLDKGGTQATIQGEMSKWRPDVRSVTRQTAFEKVSSNISKLTPEERKKLLADLQKAC